jgi:hypothetical protein
METLMPDHPAEPTPDTGPRLAELSDLVWRRHANPWSVWTRLLSVPLVFVPFWTRSRSQGAAVAAWMAINPVAFPEPRDRNEWAARAIRGERLWVAARRRDASFAIQAVGSAALLVGCYTAYRRRPAPTAACALAVMVCNGWFLDRMARQWGDDPESSSGSR